MKTKFFSLFLALGIPCTILAQNTTTQTGTSMQRGSDASTMIGNMSRAEFDRRNKEGGAMVQAITPTSTPLSAADQKLMMRVAAGGMMQLAVSQAALGRLTREDARVLAQSEVEEQTAVAAKLQEIARAKGVTLPATPDEDAQEMISKMQGMSATELDRYYVKGSGVKGHVKLEKTMAKVQAGATDPALKALATATLPVIRMHMQVSQQALDKMGKGGSTAGR